MKKFILFPLLFSFCIAIAQNENNIYPSSWWVGMKNQSLQVMIHHKLIGHAKNHIYVNYPGVKLLNVQTVKNPNYLFINFDISPQTKAGTLIIENGLGIVSTEYKIALYSQAKGNGSNYALGINSSDFIYLLMPDRFSNGDANNDHYANMRDTVVDRNNPLARHGGDLQGVVNHLDYIKQLGATAI